MTDLMSYHAWLVAWFAVAGVAIALAVAGLAVAVRDLRASRRTAPVVVIGADAAGSATREAA